MENLDDRVQRHPDKCSRHDGANGIRIQVNLSNRMIAGSPSEFERQELFSEQLRDTNYFHRDFVKWSDPVASPVGDLSDGIAIKQHSLNLIVIPLAPAP